MLKRTVLLIYIIIQTLKVAESVLCWQCDSLNYRTCAVQICQGNRCQTRTAMNGVVSHMCAVSMGADGCRDEFGAKVCVCSGDKCNNEGINDSDRNGGSMISVSHVILLVIFLGAGKMNT